MVLLRLVVRWLSPRLPSLPLRPPSLSSRSCVVFGCPCHSSLSSQFLPLLVFSNMTLSEPQGSAVRRHLLDGATDAGNAKVHAFQVRGNFFARGTKLPQHFLLTGLDEALSTQTLCFDHALEHGCDWWHPWPSSPFVQHNHTHTSSLHSLTPLLSQRRKTLFFQHSCRVTRGAFFGRPFPTYPGH